MLNKPEFKPLRAGPNMVFGTPVLKKPEISPSMPVPPVAVFPKPDIAPFNSVPPRAVLKKPELSVPVLLKPE